LDIPESDRKALAVLRDLPPDTLSQLLLEIERSPGSVPSVEGVSPKDAKQLMDVLNDMHRIRAFAEVEIDRFASDICETLREQDQLKQSDEPKLRERLTRVLEIDALAIAAKASILHGEHEHRFCSARILTDARPVYGPGQSPSAPPPAMIVTHTLKVSYHEGPRGLLNDIYFSLGSKDLTELLELLHRAQDKAKSLQQVFDSSKTRFIDPQQ